LKGLVGNVVTGLGHGLTFFDLPLALVLGPLLGEGAGEVEPLDTVLFDEDLAEANSGSALLFERELQLLLGDQALLDEDGADQVARDNGRIHGPSIGNPSFELYPSLGASGDC